MDLIVQRIGDGWEARYGGKTWRAAVGRNGIQRHKAEGDGVSPAGCWPIRAVLYRADNLGTPPRSVFATAAIDPQDSWCDAPEHPDYNRLVRLPFAATREELWRHDDLYDIVVVLGHNDNPIIPGRGSAIFLHVASPGYGSTEGCASMTHDDLLEFLLMAAPGTRLCFQDD